MSDFGMDAGTVRGWSKRFGELGNRVGPCVARPDARFQATNDLRGLLESVEGKNKFAGTLGRHKESLAIKISRLAEVEEPL